MNCNDVSHLAPLYSTGELEPDRADTFSAHLAACPACRRELEKQTAFDEMLRFTVLAGHLDTTAIDRRVRRKIAAEHRRWILVAGGIAAILALALVSFRILLSTGLPPRLKPLYAAAAHDHQVEITERQPRKWLTDRASIENLAARQGLPAAAIADFAPARYHLAQARLCFLGGRVFLHLVYADDAGNFSIFLRRRDPSLSLSAGKLIQTGTLAGEHLAGFEHPRVTALLVTEQPAATALHLATFAAAAL